MYDNKIVKKCPRCGSNQVGEKTEPFIHSKHVKFLVYCEECRFTTTSYISSSLARFDWNKAIEIVQIGALQ